MSDTILFDQDSNESDESLGFELFFSGGDVVESESDGLIWKEIMRTGTWKYRPVNGRPVKKEMTIVSGHSSNENEIGFDDLIEAFNDNAIQHVTIPTSHDDKPHENTGYIRALKKGVRNGREVLMAAFDFTEPDIKGKVLRGSIANTSAGILPGYINKFTGKKYAFALGHAALTNNPWLTGMDPFDPQLSEDDEIHTLLFDEEATEEETSVESSEENHEETSTEETEEETTEVEESEEESSDEEENAEESVENDINEGGNDMSDSSTESVESNETELSNDSVTETDLSEVRQEFADELAARDAENEKLRAQVHASKVKEAIEELKTNFGDFPGLLSEVKQIMLADAKEEKIIAFSEEVDGKTEEVKLSASEIVLRVLNALPTDKIKELSFSDEFTSTDDHSRPDVNLSDSEKGDSLADFLGLNLPKKEGDN